MYLFITLHKTRGRMGFYRYNLWQRMTCITASPRCTWLPLVATMSETEVDIVAATTGDLVQRMSLPNGATVKEGVQFIQKKS